MLHAQLLGSECRLGRRHTRLCGLFRREVLVDLLRTQRAGILQRARAFCIDGGIGGIGFGFHQAGARLCDIGCDRFTGERGEHLAGAYPVTDIDQHVAQPQTIRFTADTCLLPRCDIPVRQ